MCLLVVCEPNSTPQREELHTGACKNPHGFGFAIIADGKIISERSMSAKKSINRFLELRAQYPNSYAMWHARYATHGVKNEQNCHPFKVGDSDLTYLAHNGMLDITPAKDDKRSDTRIFAEDWLPMLGGVKALDNPVMLELLSGWADYNKICVLTVDPEAGYCMYLINEHLGKWVDGIWWSNDGYKKVEYKPTTYVTGGTITTTNAWSEDKYEYADQYERRDEFEEFIEECIWCGQDTDLSLEPFFCTKCDKCFECADSITACLCYNPEKEYASMWYKQGY